MTAETNRWILRVQLSPPTLQDNTADTDRLIGALKSALRSTEVYSDIALIRRIPVLIREYDYKATCILFKNDSVWQLIDLAPYDFNGHLLGIAVDLGTSRVVLRLIDLASGEPCGEAAFDNPQIAVAPDILARIHFAQNTKGLNHLTHLIISGLNEQIGALCRGQGVSSQDIYLVAVAGNTAMTHLFMGLDARWMIREPYIPAVNRPGVTAASDLGLDLHPAARAFIFPNVGSYFGGDLIAGILYAGLHGEEETGILVDVGTNAEVVVGNRDWLIACAGAAGPALEGGVTRMGMMAARGVIDRVEIDPKTHDFKLHTIGETPPVGICGSGVIDLAAQLFLTGMIDFRGRIVPSVCGERCFEKDGLMHLKVVFAKHSATGKDLTISQADIDSLVRSKAAMYTILETITQSVGIELNDIRKFYVAGTFGSFINPQSAVSIGMLPDIPLRCFQPLGNSSLNGAAMLLAHCACMDEIDEIRNRITYLELNVNQAFMNRFSAAKFLPHTDTSLFPSVGR
ncbi:MAG: ASKHA domain-containing protein [Desulfobacterales bacterium]